MTAIALFQYFYGRVIYLKKPIIAYKVVPKMGMPDCYLVLNPQVVLTLMYGTSLLLTR